MNMIARPSTGVSRTAVVIAQARALEHQRPDRLFDDELAEKFVESTGWIQVAEAGRQNQDHFALRTRFFDDYFRACVGRGCEQVVLLAAGLDTRAFRLEWPERLRLFEVDLPGVTAFKEAVLGVCGARPACSRAVVTSDLRGDWEPDLLAAGFDPTRPTAWLIEGLLMYLEASESDLLVQDVTQLSAVGSTLALEHVNHAYVDLPQMQVVQQRLAKFGAAWKSTLEDPEAWLGEYGWRAEVTPHPTLAARHGRPVPPLTDPRLVGAARMWLVSAVLEKPATLLA